MQHVNGHIPLHRRELAQVAEQVLQHGLLLLRAVGELIQPVWNTSPSSTKIAMDIHFFPCSISFTYWEEMPRRSASSSLLIRASFRLWYTRSPTAFCSASFFSLSSIVSHPLSQTLDID